MDPTLLRDFLAIHRAGSLSAAAKTLAISQSALTKRLMRLEDELRVRLFERHNRGLIPTAIGTMLAHHAEELQAGLEAATAMVQEFRAGTQGHVRIGASPQVATLLLPRVTLRLRAAQPLVSLTVVDGLTPELTAAVRAGRVDFAVCSSPYHEDRTDLAAEFLVDDHFGIVAGRDYPLPGNGRPKLVDLADHPWVMTPYIGVPRRWFMEQFERAGATAPVPAVETVSLPYFRALVVSGTFLGFSAREMFHDQIQAGILRPVLKQELTLKRGAVILTRRTAIHSAAATAALELIRREVRDHPVYSDRRR